MTNYHKHDRTTFPELTDLTSETTYVSNNIFGVVYGYKKQPNVVYTCLGEIPKIDELLTQFTDSFTILVTTRDYSPEYESKYNCRIIKIPSAYAWYTTQLKKEDINFNKQFEKYFLSLAHRAQWHRQALFQFVNKFNLQDKFYMSYHCGDLFKEGTRDLYNRVNDIIDTTWYNEGLDLDRLYDQLPVTTGYADNFDPSHWDIGHRDYYEKSFISIVSEGYTNENGNPHFTEKVMRPIAYGQPFFVFSSTGLLNKLNTLGFETFSDIIDESYDQIENTNQRFEHILKEVLRISRLDINEIQKMYNHVQPRIVKNYEYFWNEWHSIYSRDIAEVKTQIKELIK
jgi:hypothetical protein